MDRPVDRKKPSIPSNYQTHNREQSSHLRKLALSERVNNLEVGSARGLALVYPRVASQICWLGRRVWDCRWGLALGTLPMKLNLLSFVYLPCSPISTRQTPVICYQLRRLTCTYSRLLGTHLLHR